MDNEPKRNKIIRYCVNAFVFGFVLYIGIQAWNAYNGEFDKIYDFTPPQLSDDEFMTGFVEEYNLQYDVSLNHNVVLHTTSLSAQNPINIEVWVYPSTKYIEAIPNQWKTMPDYVTIVFPNAIVHNETEKSLRHDLAVIRLDRDDEPKEYYANSNIMYQFEGQQGYFFMLPSEMDKYTIDGQMYLSSGYIENKTKRAPPFYVGGSEQTINLKQNDIFLALTLVFVDFALIEARVHIVSFFLWTFGKK